MRFAHYFVENKATDYPQQAIWMDTESRMTFEDRDPYKSADVIWYGSHTEFEPKVNDTVYHWLKFGYACYMRAHREGKWTDEEWLKFTTRTQFWDFVCTKARKQTKLYVFCHNTSFDLPVLDVFNELPKRGYVLKSAIIDAPPTILRFRNDTKCIMIIDTLNIWRMPLAFLGEEIGLPKLDMPDNNDLTVEWESYGRRDVEILRAACIKWWDFLRENDFGSFAPTLAGQAMRVYRHRYMKHKIFIDSNERALKLTREGYYGGRCECFRIGKFTGDFSAWDVNSMYPFVMAVNRFPCKLLSHTYYANIRDLKTWLQTYAVTSRVLLRTSKPFAAVRNGGKLVFPIGEFEAILSTPEIKYALMHAEILEVREVAVYEQEYLFSDFVNDLYFRKQDSKRQGDTVKEFMYKKLLNSFYGKWGQSGGKWMEEDNCEDLSAKRWIEKDMVTGDIIYHRQLGGLHQIKSTEEESRESFPAIAAHVTAYARMHLWSIVELAQTTNVYYCDTDCVVVSADGTASLNALIDEYRLGALKKVGIYEEIELWGAKDYRFGTKEKHKGVRKNAIWENDHTVVQASWSGLRGLLSSGIVDRPLTKTIRKHLTRLYDKGEVLQDGTVLPLSFHRES
jgi:DNA polymerase family B